MLNKLYELFKAANEIQPYEDKYSFKLNFINKNDCKFLFSIEHEYVNKTANHPVSIIYSNMFNEINEIIISEIKEKLIKRQTDLISIRQRFASEKLEEFRRANEELTNRIAHFENIKKI